MPFWRGPDLDRRLLRLDRCERPAVPELLIGDYAATRGGRYRANSGARASLWDKAGWSRTLSMANRTNSIFAVEHCFGRTFI